MERPTFKDRMQKDFGAYFAEIVDVFFKNATEEAINGNLDEAISIANDALVFAKYSNDRYSILYIVGMMCQAYLDNNQPELSEKFFKYGMSIIKQTDFDFERDINSFLDLKILIDQRNK